MEHEGVTSIRRGLFLFFSREKFIALNENKLNLKGELYNDKL